MLRTVDACEIPRALSKLVVAGGKGGSIREPFDGLVLPSQLQAHFPLWAQSNRRAAALATRNTTSRRD